MEQSISEFVDLIIDQKKLQFGVDEIYYADELFENRILTQEREKTFIDFSRISSHFIEKYKGKFDFETSWDFAKNVKFINRLKEDFLINGYVPDYHLLEKELWKSIVEESNSQQNCYFEDYLNSIGRENRPKGFFNFVEAYSEALPRLEMPVGIMFSNTLTLKELTKNDVPNNLDWNNVLFGIKAVCKVQYELGLKLFEKSLLVSYDESLIAAIVSGLYENKRAEFYTSVVKDLIEKGNKRGAIFLGLSSIEEPETSDCELFKYLIEEYYHEQSMAIPLTSLAFAILKSDNKGYSSYCFSTLTLLIRNEKTAYLILNNFILVRNHTEKKTDVIIELIQQNYFALEKYIDPISRVLIESNKFGAFKKVVSCLLERKPFEKFISSFQSYLREPDRLELDTFVINLLIDNKANKRFIGIGIFDQLSTFEPHRFALNILQLPPISQYKLWVSLTQGFQEPKLRLTALLPLIDSENEFVRESFLWKLEELTEDYGNHITMVLETHLDKSNEKHLAVIQRIKNYTEMFYANNADPKESVAEFNPFHTQLQLITRFNELLNEKMRKTLDRGSEKNSVLSLLGTKTVLLSKGGGWRSGNKKEISQLGRVRASFTLPRSYFIHPIKYDIEKFMSVREDWADDHFLSIQKIIDNE